MITNSKDAINKVYELVEWLKEYRDLSDTIVSDEELEAIEYLLDTYKYY